MPIFVGFNLFLPLFPLGLSPLGTSVKQTNLVKETGDLNNSKKVNAVALEKRKMLVNGKYAELYLLNSIRHFP